MTVDKFAEVFGIERNVAYGLLRFLADAKLVQTSKLPQPEGKKGKPATIYHLDEQVGQRFVEHLKQKLGNQMQLAPQVQAVEVPVQAPTPTESIGQ
jgi:predicted transcriptional regulator